MTRIAYLSPLPPEKTGIADYSRWLLEELATRVEVDAFSPGRPNPIPGVRLRRAGRRALHRLDGYDAVIAHMGNSGSHAWILKALPHARATVVLHEVVLHHLIANITLGRGDKEGYLDAMEREAGAPGRMLAHGVIDQSIPPLWEIASERFPLAGEALRHARATIVHSRFAAAWVARHWPNMRVATIPMLAPPAADTPAERLPGNPFPVIGVFGFVTAQKRLPSLMAAFSHLVVRRPRARLLVVGTAPETLDPLRLARAAGVPDDAIEVVGFADGERFGRLLRSVDIGVNLRHPTLGETSATVVRWLALGTPVIVSSGGWYDELPDDAVARIPPDADEVRLLATVLERLTDDDRLRADMGQAGRRYAQESLSAAAAGDAYLRFVLSPAGEPALTEQLIASVSARIAEIAPGGAAQATGLTRRVAQAARGGGHRVIARVLRAVEARPWRAVLVLAGLAAAIRFGLAQGTASPWIFTDEFIYSEQARSLAESGQLRIRDQSVYYSLVTPLLDAPGYLMGRTSAAYAWMKGANAVVMAAAALPAYGLARMALSVRLSLVFAVLVLALPAYAYTATIMTEPAFFTAVLLVTWLLARALQRPTLWRQALVAGATLLCLAVRLQAVTLLPTIFLAAAFAVLAGGGSGRAGLIARARAHMPLIAFSVLTPLAVLAFQYLRGSGIRELLGGYGGLDPGRTGLGPVWTWTVRHLAVIALAVGIVPAALAVAAFARLLRRRFAPDGRQAVLVASLAVAVPLIIQVAAFASAYALRVQERNLFAVEPLLVLAALIALSEMGVSRIVAIGAAGAAAAAIMVLPVSQLLTPPPLSDTFTLLSLMRLGEGLGVAPDTLAGVLGILAVGLTIGAVLASRKIVALVLPAALLVVLVGMNAHVTPLLRDYSRAVAASTTGSPPDWIDRAVGRDARVAFVWPSEDDPKLVWQAEFWNHSVRTILAVPGEMPALQTPRASIDEITGRFVPLVPGGEPPEAFAVVPDRWQMAGARVAHARTGVGGLTLWRVKRPLGLRLFAQGLYGDGWTAPEVRLRAFGCSGGAFVLPLGLGYGTEQRVRVEAGGATPGMITLHPAPLHRLRFPVRPDDATSSTCSLTLTVLNAKTGHEIAGNGDPRLLGVRTGTPKFLASVTEAADADRSRR